MKRRHFFTLDLQRKNIKLKRAHGAAVPVLLVSESERRTVVE